MIPNDLEDPYPATVEYFTGIEEKMRKSYLSTLAAVEMVQLTDR